MARLAKPAFYEVVCEDNKDAISVSSLMSTRSCGDEVNCHVQVVHCEVEKLGVLGTSFRTSFDLQFVAESPKEKSVRGSRRRNIAHS